MSEATFRDLSRALAKIDRPGSFCVSVPAVLPGLEIDGLGPIGLPLTAGQAEELKGRCEQAPYGKGEQTVVDTSVRRVWRLTPDRFALKDPHEQVHRFGAVEHRRRHLEEQIRGHGSDLDLKTERRGSPHTLVATKNRASYEAKLKTFRENQGHLATVRAIEASLPR